MPQGAALQHAELVEQKQRVVTAAVKMPVPGRAFLFAMGRADQTVHVQHDILQPIAVRAVHRSLGPASLARFSGKAGVPVSNRPICDADADSACASTHGHRSPDA